MSKDLWPAAAAAAAAAVFEGRARAEAAGVEASAECAPINQRLGPITARSPRSSDLTSFLLQPTDRPTDLSAKTSSAHLYDVAARIVRTFLSIRPPL